MVNLRGKRYGIDLCGDRVRIAARTFSSGRDYLDSFVDSSPDRLDQDIIDTDADCFFSIGESDAIIKNLNILEADRFNNNEMAQFELSCTLLNGQDKYFYESYDTGLPAERLAVAYNRKLINKRIEYLKARIKNLSGFKLRSLAMVRAYNKFCNHEGGRLICLLDADPAQASFCILNGKSPVLIGSVGGSNGANRNETELEQSFILDLAGTLKFRLLELHETLRSLPVSRIILTGFAADDNLADMIASQTGIQTELPPMKKDISFGQDNSEAYKFLVPLGLTLDD